MGKRNERKQHTATKLLTAAGQYFAEKGYAGCSVADIAERAAVA